MSAINSSALRHLRQVNTGDIYLIHQVHIKGYLPASFTFRFILTRSVLWLFGTVDKSVVTSMSRWVVCRMTDYGSFTPAIYYTIAFAFAIMIVFFSMAWITVTITIAKMGAQPILEYNGNCNRNDNRNCNYGINRSCEWTLTFLMQYSFAAVQFLNSDNNWDCDCNWHK